MLFFLNDPKNIFCYKMAFDPDIALNKDFKVKLFYVYGGLPSAPDLGESLKRLCAPHQFLLSTAI